MCVFPLLSHSLFLFLRPHQQQRVPEVFSADIEREKGGFAKRDQFWTQCAFMLLCVCVVVVHCYNPTLRHRIDSPGPSRHCAHVQTHTCTPVTTEREINIHKSSLFLPFSLLFPHSLGILPHVPSLSLSSLSMLPASYLSFPSISQPRITNEPPQQQQPAIPYYNTSCYCCSSCCCCCYTHTAAAAAQCMTHKRWPRGGGGGGGRSKGPPSILLSHSQQRSQCSALLCVVRGSKVCALHTHI